MSEGWLDHVTRFSGVEAMRGAELIRALPGGPASSSFLLEVNGRRLVARIDTPAARELKLNRQSELEVLQAVSGTGIGPELVWANPGHGLLVCTYIEGPAADREEIGNPELLRGLASTLKRLHELPPCGPEFKPEQAARQYAESSGTLAAMQLADRVCQLAEELREGSTERALCHNDLVHSNIIKGPPVRLIDWEYAAVGDPFFDLAVVIQHHQLSTAQRDVFLQAYFRCPSPEKLVKLEDYCRLYDYLSCLWYQSMIKSFRSMPGFDSELRRIMARLDDS